MPDYNPYQGIQPLPEKQVPQTIRFLADIGRRWPLPRGRSRLLSALIPLIGDWPGLVCCEIDGLSLMLDLRETLDRWLYLFGEHEPDVKHVLRDVLRPGDAYADIGANMGYFCLEAARLLGRDGQVHCFEPVPATHARLMMNLRQNQMPAQIADHRLALSDHAGKAEFYAPPGGSSALVSLRPLNDDFVKIGECQIVSFDEFANQNHLPPITLMKIDVEGAELSVLRGAGASLANAAPPMLLLEANFSAAEAWGYQIEDVLAYLGGHGYVFYAIHHDGRASAVARATDLWNGCNFIALKPDAHADRVQTLMNAKAR
jgi:FkbM family methyltransferase